MAVLRALVIPISLRLWRQTKSTNALKHPIPTEALVQVLYKL